MWQRISLIFSMVMLPLWVVSYAAQSSEQFLGDGNEVERSVLYAEHVEDTPAALEELHPISLLALAQQTFDGKDLKLGQVQAETATYTRYFITYTGGGLEISGIMNVPHGEGPFPVLILNHGYIDPSVYTNGRGLKREQDYFAQRGYIVIHPDYRNHASSSRVEEDHLNMRLGYTEDVINAVYAVKASDWPFVDREHIGMMGHSMGGGITLNILVSHPDLIQAALLYAPVSADYRDNFDKWTRNRASQAEAIIDSYGDFEMNPAFWDGISPLAFLDEVSAPIAVHHGTADESVPLEWSDKLVKALESAGKVVEYFVYAGEKHELIPQWSLMMERADTFFDEYLRNDSFGE